MGDIFVKKISFKIRLVILIILTLNDFNHTLIIRFFSKLVLCEKRKMPKLSQNMYLWLSAKRNRNSSQIYLAKCD